MTPERWSQIQEKLDVAVSLEPAQRAAFLKDVGTTDPDMRQELESLLSQETGATGFLKTSSKFLLEHLAHGRDPMIGRRLGPYQVTDLLGVGGMGEVYRAVRADDEYKKQVAIKLVRAQDFSLVLGRFKNERQILASLDQPNIAHLLDGGTTQEGVPYLVMELIEGEPIDEYCDHHKLDINRRLQLFLQVCAAVQYAHSRLIVHRDLKPGNILVTADGQPKLLDFGIAKILEPGILGEGFSETVTMMRALTPAYASPEQIKGETITTATDVYSLGVILYELLTGHHPYRVTGRNVEAISREVLAVEPEKPSSVVRRTEPAAGVQAEITPATVSAVREGTPDKLRNRLSGDLDNIVLMALRKEPQRRYGSVEQFATDIRRHLQNLPVIARKDTARYRATKFVIRHKAGVSAAVCVAVVLLVAFIVVLREARIAKQQAELAREQRARAERRFNDVRKLANSLIFEIHDSVATLPGATKAREVLVKRALEYLDSLSRESPDPALQRELAAAYDRIGDVQGNNGMPNLNDFSGASASYAKALAIRESLVAANANNAGLRLELLRSYFRAATGFEMIGDFDSDLRAMQKGQPLAIALPRGTGMGEQQFNMSGVYYYSGKALERSGHWAEALASYQQASSLMEPVAFAPQSGLLPRAYLAAQYVTIGKLLAELGRGTEGVAIASKGLDMFRKLSDDNPNIAPLREGLANEYGDFVDVLIASGDLNRALQTAHVSKKIKQAVADADPANGMARADVGWGDIQIGEILLRQGNANEAEPIIREALSLFQQGNPANKYWYAIETSQAYLDLGELNAARAKRASSPASKRRLWTEASSYYQKALESRASGPGQLNSDGHDQVGEIRTELAKANTALAQLGRTADERKQ